MPAESHVDIEVKGISLSGKTLRFEIYKEAINRNLSGMVRCHSSGVTVISIEGKVEQTASYLAWCYRKFTPMGAMIDSDCSGRILNYNDFIIGDLTIKEV